MVKSLPAMRETGVRSQGWEDPLGQETATHTSILTWKIPWMDEPGELQSMGLQRVGHNWATNTYIQHNDHLILDSLIRINCMYIFKMSLLYLLNHSRVLAHWSGMIRIRVIDIGGTWHQEECCGQVYDPKNVTGFLLIILQVSFLWSHYTFLTSPQEFPPNME